MREHLIAEARNGGVMPDPRLSAAVPRGGESIWAAFTQLSGARPMGFGIGAIPPSEVVAWQTLNGVQLTPWELDTITALDAATLDEFAQQRKQQATAKKGK